MEIVAVLLRDAAATQTIEPAAQLFVRVMMHVVVALLPGLQVPRLTGAEREPDDEATKVGKNPAAYAGNRVRVRRRVRIVFMAARTGFRRPTGLLQGDRYRSNMLRGR